MQQHDGERAVEQQQDLARERRRLRDPGRLEGPAQPFLELLLVCGADFHRGVAGHVGEFGRCAQEAAALPLRMPRRAGEVAKDALDLSRQSVVGLREPLPEQREIGLVAGGEVAATRSSLLLK